MMISDVVSSIPHRPVAAAVEEVNDPPRLQVIFNLPPMFVSRPSFV